MKLKSMIIFAELLAVVLILAAGAVVGAAAPEGEIKIVAPMFGTEVPVPYLENAHGHDYLKLIYDPLVGTTADGELSSDYGLADKWEMAPDGLTWTFFLKKGIKFHDGVEVTAKDAKFTIELVMRPESRATYAGNIRSALKGVEVKDPYTLIVHCKKPSLFLPYYFSDMGGPDGLIVPKDAYEKAGKDRFVKNPIGSGPYKFHSQMVGSSIKLEAAGKHWRDGVPRYRYVTFLIVPEESARTAMLKTGEADITRTSRERINELQEAGCKIVSKKDHAVVMFWPNMQWTSPIFSDVRFRRALNLALDKDMIIKHLFAGRAKRVAQYPGSAIRGAGDPNLEPYPYDPEEAKRLIKEAGYVGHEFTVPSFKRSGCPEIQRLIETACGYWEKIGLKPKIFNTEFSPWRKKWRAQKVHNSVMGTDSSVSPLLPELLARFRQKLYSTQKRTLVKIPEVDATLDKAANSLDTAEVKTLIKEIYRYGYDQYLWIPICSINDEIATTKRIPEWNPSRRRNDRNYNDLIRQR